MEITIFIEVVLLVFWEVLNNENTTGVTLQILNNNLDGGDIIDKCHFPTQQTYIRNNFLFLKKLPQFY